jgi:hypothetical protein
VPFEQAGHGEDRADAHFVGLAAGDREAAEDPERGKAAPFGVLGLHHHAGRRAVGELAGVAGGDDAVLSHRFQPRQPLGGGIGARPLVMLQRDLFVRDLLGLLVDDGHTHGNRRDLGVEAAGLARRRDALLRLQAVCVLALARDVVAFGDDLGGVDHRQVDLRLDRHQLVVHQPERVAVVVLHQADRFQSAGDSRLHAVIADGVGQKRHRLQAGGALPVDRGAGD